jgi:hypothetical protein
MKTTASVTYSVWSSCSEAALCDAVKYTVGTCIGLRANTAVQEGTEWKNYNAQVLSGNGIEAGQTFELILEFENEDVWDETTEEIVETPAKITEDIVWEIVKNLEWQLPKKWKTSWDQGYKLNFTAQKINLGDKTPSE